MQGDLRRMLNWCRNREIDPLVFSNDEIENLKDEVNRHGYNWKELIILWKQEERNWINFKEKYNW